ncbi:SDR family NAD(P)-dependent oxidoreductase [Calidifontibacter sp. DB0510]|uniref:SDR family NAD(P)-dependent oxidoreductase n=1 Tax=Metallococcus carri TaxID=1656884 RepID=A0A967AYE0_9MICO|nr:SDR family NAD(P)-dependent oxidoreductase [Metallococcus carri]NHN55304.1 SDR family NAD(P)-dependent oxidoreductase [Metallococcus carri]NOP36381.1 SDR family NAD(P)-dependent oxidoreductase [Calidifontibacter sp. DB2511S]
MSRRLAVVTGASSGIGRASARRLAADGFEVICAARRTDRIEALAAEIGGRAVTCDVTKAEDIARLAAETGDRLDVLVANAGGAFGTETVAEADFDDWRAMYETNVIGVAASIQTLLPALIAAHGVIITIGSYAGHVAYEGGAGYTGVKHAVRALMQSLRLEVFDQPVRVCEIDPGLVHSDEFSLVRYRGDAAKAEAVYAGVVDPLQQEDVAECVAFAASRPEHVNIDPLMVRPRAQAAVHKLHRHS